MSGPEATMAQITIMVDFMERNGDLSKFQEGNVKDELENLQKWIELTDVLNDKCIGDPKPLDGWKKTWESLKNKVQSKYQRTGKKRGGQLKPTEIAKRIMAVMKKKDGDINRKRKLTESSGQEDDDEEVVTEEQNISEDESDNQEENEKDQDKDNDEQNNNYDIAVPTRSKFFWALQTSMIPFNDSSRAGDYFEASTSAVSLHRCSKRQRQDCNDLVAVAEKFLEFEKKKAVLEHGRQLLKLKQDQRYFSIMGGIVKTLQATSSAMTKCVDGLLSLC